MSSGRSRGEAWGAQPPYFSTKVRPNGPKKIFLRPGSPPLYLSVWMTAPSPLSEELDPPLMSVQSGYLPAIGYT